MEFKNMRQQVEQLPESEVFVGEKSFNVDKSLLKRYNRGKKLAKRMERMELFYGLPLVSQDTLLNDDEYLDNFESVIGEAMILGNMIDNNLENIEVIIPKILLLAKQAHSLIENRQMTPEMMIVFASSLGDEFKKSYLWNAFIRDGNIGSANRMAEIYEWDGLDKDNPERRNLWNKFYSKNEGFKAVIERTKRASHDSCVKINELSENEEREGINIIDFPCGTSEYSMYLIQDLMDREYFERENVKKIKIKLIDFEPSNVKNAELRINEFILENNLADNVIIDGVHVKTDLTKKTSYEDLFDDSDIGFSGGLGDYFTVPINPNLDLVNDEMFNDGNNVNSDFKEYVKNNFQQNETLLVERFDESSPDDEGTCQILFSEPVKRLNSQGVINFGIFKYNHPTTTNMNVLANWPLIAKPEIELIIAFKRAGWLDEEVLNFFSDDGGFKIETVSGKIDVSSVAEVERTQWFISYTKK